MDWLMSSQTGRVSARKVEFCVFLLHWIVVAAVVVSGATGWRIAVDDPYSAIGGYVSPIDGVLPTGSVHQWHVMSGFILTAAATAYFILLVVTTGIRRVRDPVGLRKHYAATSSASDFWSSRITWRILRVKTYHLAFLLVALMATTGWLLFFDAPFVQRNQTASLHGISSALFIIYALVHVSVQLKAGVFKSIFLPHFGKLWVGLGALAIVSVGFWLIYASREFPVSALKVNYVERPPVLDGKDDDAAWVKAKPINLQAFKGENSAREVSIQVRAVRDKESIYFLFKWSDPTPSRKYMPLIKMEDGWRVLQSGFDKNDENEFYEDKFAVLFSRESTSGSGTVHLGPGMRPGVHRDVTRGLHYTEDGSVVDVWHWKATRTAAMIPGMMDDNHFGPPLPSGVEGARYTGGYTQDPHSDGGYTLNWEKIDSNAPLTEGYVLPRYLPKDRDIVNHATRSHLAGGDEDEPIWHMYRSTVLEYHPDIDDYEVGSILPGVIINGAFVGDRGDIFSEAQWEDGVWTLEASRRLTTGSKYDVDFTLDENIYFWIATFDNAQIRHSYQMRPGRLVVEN